MEQLFRKYLNNEATPQEVEQLIQQFGIIENEAELRSLILSSFENNEAANKDEHLLKLATNKVFSSIKEQMSAAKTKAVPLYQKTWFRVAASVLFILSASAYFIFKGQQPEKITLATREQRFKNDVMPGGNKALLTLGNGNTIILDSAVNGTLSQQGSTTIIKLDNGQLAYNTDGKTTEVLYNTISTPRGGQYQVTLADGTKVWLNAASSLRFPAAFMGKERKVEITGEVYFEVAKNAAMPFTVQVKDMEIEVLGTHFNMNAYDEEALIKTTLLEGSVKVKSGSSSSLLQPGQQAQLGKDRRLNIKPDADIEETMAWKNGRFMFKGADIKTIMNQVARWYDVDINYQGNISDIFVADIAKDIPVSKLLILLEQTERVHFLIEGKKITVIP